MKFTNCSLNGLPTKDSVLIMNNNKESKVKSIRYNKQLDSLTITMEDDMDICFKLSKNRKKKRPKDKPHNDKGIFKIASDLITRIEKHENRNK